MGACRKSTSTTWVYNNIVVLIFNSSLSRAVSFTITKIRVVPISTTVVGQTYYFLWMDNYFARLVQCDKLPLRIQRLTYILLIYPSSQHIKITNRMLYSNYYYCMQ